jgi:type IV pilus assembly protein PilE
LNTSINRRQRGITLLELMIVVAIIAIIAAVGYPSYLESVRKTRRADCAGVLTALANAMERHYSITGSYLGAATGGGNTGAPAVFDTACPIDGGEATYNLTISAATASTYTLQAAPTGGHANDSCGTLTLTNTGVKGVADAASGYDWQKCWR